MTTNDFSQADQFLLNIQNTINTSDEPTIVIPVTSEEAEDCQSAIERLRQLPDMVGIDFFLITRKDFCLWAKIQHPSLAKEVNAIGTDYVLSVSK